MDINPENYNYKSLAIGATVKWPHLGCSKSPAMKIQIRAEGAFFYCHKCNSHTFVPFEGQSWRDRKQREAEYAAVQNEKSRRGFDLPADFSHQIEAAGLAWLGLGGWTADLIDRYKIGWSDKLNRVVIPLQPEGCTARAVFKDQRPKYLEKAPSVCWWDSEPIQPGLLVITEDILSAGRVGKFVQTRALLGTPKRWIPPEGIKAVLIWTDNDPAGLSTRRLVNDTCLWMALAVGHIETDKDPKKYSDREIKEILCTKVIKPSFNC
jgi:hypothetical protein